MHCTNALGHIFFSLCLVLMFFILFSQSVHCPNGFDRFFFSLCLVLMLMNFFSSVCALSQCFWSHFLQFVSYSNVLGLLFLNTTVGHLFICVLYQCSKYSFLQSVPCPNVIRLFQYSGLSISNKYAMTRSNQNPKPRLRYTTCYYIIIYMYFYVYAQCSMCT